MQIRSIRTTNVQKLIAWCRHYGREGPYQQSSGHRFGIGVYQIAQGMKWKGGKRNSTKRPRYESYAASCIHFLIATELLEADTWAHLPPDLREIPGGEFGYSGWRELMFHVSSAQRMVSYAVHFKATKTKWNARYDPDFLAKHTAEAIKLLMSLILVPKRAGAVQIAMDEMLPKAVRR